MMDGWLHSAVLADGTDQTATLEGESERLCAAGGGTLILPRGVIHASILTLRDRVSLRGAGRGVTTLRATGSAPAFITLASGPVQSAWLSDLSVLGSGTPGQAGIYLHGQGDDSPAHHGGWWHSGMRRVSVRGFAGDQIWLRGGGDDYLTPHQFLTLDSVDVHTAATARALRISGQVGQVTLLGGQYDGPGQANPGGVNISISREVTDDLTVASDVAPYSLAFLGVTCQQNEAGLWVERSQSVAWLHGHMERLSRGIDATTSARVRIEGGTYGTVGTDGGAGFIVRSGPGAVVYVNGATFPATADADLLRQSGAILVN